VIASCEAPTVFSAVPFTNRDHDTENRHLPTQTSRCFLFQLGMMAAWPKRSSRACASGTPVGICLVQLLVPYVPPVHPLLRAFADHPVPNPWPVLGVTAGETVLLAAAAVAVAHVVARSRT
jgi:hypothetical protein